MCSLKGCRCVYITISQLTNGLLSTGLMNLTSSPVKYILTPKEEMVTENNCNTIFHQTSCLARG